MKKPGICILFVFLASLASASPGEDRAAIGAVIAALNNHSQPASTLFTAEGANSSELNRLAGLDRMLAGSPQPLSEETPPWIMVRSVRFITSDVALVDGANTRYGSISLRTTVPVLLVMKREGANWRIASFRVLVNLSALP